MPGAMSQLRQEGEIQPRKERETCTRSEKPANKMTPARWLELQVVIMTTTWASVNLVCPITMVTIRAKMAFPRAKELEKRDTGVLPQHLHIKSQPSPKTQQHFPPLFFLFLILSLPLSIDGVNL